MSTFLHLTDHRDDRHELQNVEDICSVEVDQDGDTVIRLRHGGKTYVGQTVGEIAEMLVSAGHRIINPPRRESL